MKFRGSLSLSIGATHLGDEAIKSLVDCLSTGFACGILSIYAWEVKACFSLPSL
jgi:hypothetical protein